MTLRPRNLREFLALSLGSALSPIFMAAGAVIAKRRPVRHPVPGSEHPVPRHCCFCAWTRPARALHPRLESLAQRLSGMSLVRPIQLFWSGRRHLPNILSLGVRFQASPPFGVAGPQAQDLLLHSVRSPWSLPLDMLRADPVDILANEFHGFSTFDAGEFDAARLRLRAKPALTSGDSPMDRLKDAVARRDAKFLLEIRAAALSRYWEPLVEIHLLRPVELTELELDFWPFRDGLDIRPRGFIQYLWPVPYLLGQGVRALVSDWSPPAPEPEANTIPPAHRAKVVRLVPRSGRKAMARPQHPRGW